jgi:hypothetical protein
MGIVELEMLGATVDVIEVVGVSWVRPHAAREAAIKIPFKAITIVVRAAIVEKSRLHCSREAASQMHPYIYTPEVQWINQKTAQGSV